MRVDDSLKPLRKWSLRRKISVVFAFLVVAGVTFVSFLPGENKSLLHTRGKYHSWGHLLAFGVVSFVVAGTARSRHARFLLFICGILFGFGIEFGEHIIFDNPLEWKDIIVDTFGVIGGTLMAMMIPPREEEAAGGEV